MKARMMGREVEMSGVECLECSHLRTQLHAAQEAVDEMIAQHAKGCSCEPDRFCEHFGIADIREIRAALSSRPE